MKTVRFINPEVVEVEVPETDAPHFAAKGWPKAKASKAKEAEEAGAKDQRTDIERRADEDAAAAREEQAGGKEAEEAATGTGKSKNNKPNKK